MSMQSWREPPGQRGSQEWAPEEESREADPWQADPWQAEPWERAPGRGVASRATHVWEPRTAAPAGYDDHDPDGMGTGAYLDLDRDPDGMEADAHLDEDAPVEPNGGVVAAIVAAGLACAIFGFLVVLTAASPEVEKLMTFYWPAGPLTGRSTVTIVAYLVIWPNLHYRLRDRHLDLYKAFLFTLFLVGLGLIGTFPPFYQLFQGR